MAGERTEGELWNVVDVEATCWPGEPPPGMAHEIIEIGLTVLDVTRRRRVGRHRILVRPVRSTVSVFCEELTGITQDEADGGATFAQACTMLAKDFAAGTRPWASWGDYDRKQFESQCAATRTGYPFGRRHANAKAEFTRSHGLKKRPGMAQALEIAGLPLEGRHHRGEDDAWNIAALILHIVGRCGADGDAGAFGPLANRDAAPRAQTQGQAQDPRARTIG
jgi:inhibitor of KinA sporulation pathway (predicted exonuclease)